MLLITKVSLNVALETSLALQVKTGTSSIRPASPTDCSTDSLSKIPLIVDDVPAETSVNVADEAKSSVSKNIARSVSVSTASLLCFF